MAVQKLHACGRAPARAVHGVPPLPEPEPPAAPAVGLGAVAHGRAARRPRRRRSASPPALLSLALLFWHAGSSTGQYAWRTLPLLGLLLAALCLVQMARALLLGRWSWRFDSRRAAALFALVLLALLQGFAAQSLLAQRIKNEFYGTALVLVLNLCCGALLLPFLRPAAGAGALVRRAGPATQRSTVSAI